MVIKIVNKLPSQINQNTAIVLRNIKCVRQSLPNSPLVATAMLHAYKFEIIISNLSFIYFYF